MHVFLFGILLPTLVIESMARLPTIYLPHGGGPCFFMSPQPGPPGTWTAMEGFLRRLPSIIGTKPSAILMVSAHWEEDACTVQTNPKPDLLYDYYGFPDYTYELKYPAAGSPSLAARVATLLQNATIAVRTDRERGFDHGTFVPMLLSYPAADVPIVQLSLRGDLDPAFHIQIGKALAPLRDENVLIIGSGLSYHNLSQFFSGRDNRNSEVFDTWLTETLCSGSPAERERRLTEWTKAPGARACHPREEHLLPLMVAVGAGSEAAGQQIHSEKLMGKAVSAYRFG